MRNHKGLHQAIDQLTDAQAARVGDFLAALLADEEDQAACPGRQAGADPQEGGALETSNGRHAAGWVELKMIGGCGPYAYLRWRDGKRLRSRYMGKAEGLGSTNGGNAPKVAP